MARKPEARDRLIESFDRIVVEDGERAATLDAVAARAGVSKGGLLYHFSTRQDLAEASLQRLGVLAAETIAGMASSPEGAAAAFLRASLWRDTPVDRSILTASRLAQSGDETARQRLQELERQWYELLMSELQDPVVAQAVLHMGDGLYHNAAVGLLADEAAERDAVVEQLIAALGLMRRS